MNIKGIAGICICALGIYIIILAVHGIHQVSEAKGFAQSVSDFFQHNTTWNPLITFFGGEAQEKINREDTKAIMALIAGICLTVLGAVMVIVYYIRKKWW